MQREATVWSSEASKIPGIFAEAVCSALVERNYFAKARQPLIHEGVFANYEAATQWQTQLEASLQPQLTTLAARLEKYPDGKSLRAPKRRVKKKVPATCLRRISSPHGRQISHLSVRLDEPTQFFLRPCG